MDSAGFLNGRRVFDDVTTIELRTIAGVTYALVDSSVTPDKAAGAITQGLTFSHTDVTAENTEHYLPVFSYLGTPHSEYDNPATNTPAPYPVFADGPRRGSTALARIIGTAADPRHCGGCRGLLRDTELSGAAGSRLGRSGSHSR